MGTETRISKFTSRRGVAMFVVLGAVVLVTLFGYVGLTLAGKDQTLSGDLNDIKSRDEAALAGLQLGINRLTADPAQMVAVFNSFISERRVTKSDPKNVWFDLNDNTLKLQLIKDEPDWFSLSTAAKNQTATKLQLLAVAQGDTFSMPVEGKDSSAIYVSLLCKARGRHGDEKVVQATYRIHGVSLAFRSEIRSYVVPNYAFYMGSTLQSTNEGMDITGDVYVAGAAGSFLNSDAYINTNGIFKWHGDLHSNAPLSFSGPTFIDGALYVNNHGAVTFNSDAVVAGGLMTTDDNLTAKGTLWLGGPGSTSTWNSNHPLRVDGDLIFHSSGNKSGFNSSMIIKKNAWFTTGAQNFNSIDSFYVGKNLYIGNGSMLSSVGFNISSANLVKIGGSLIQYSPGTFKSNPPVTIQDSLITMGNTIAASLSVGAFNYTRGTLWPFPAAPAPSHWVQPPTLDQLGFDTIARNTNIISNPMDSLKVDSINSPEVQSHVIELTASLLSAAQAGTNDITASSLNKLYEYMTSTSQTYNGYMVLHLANSVKSGIGSGFTDDATGFTGKMLIVIEGGYDVNHSWPHSNNISNVQVIIIRNGGDLRNWGWGQGNFSGYFYWEDPPCPGGITLQLPNNAIWWGGMIIGQHVSSPCKSEFTFNTNSHVQIVRSDVVIDDIGMNLPGVMQPATGVGIPPRTIRSKAISTTSPLLRLVHTSPYFEPIGVFR